MIQLPIAVGLKVREHVVVEEKTRHVTLVNCVRRLRFREIPSPPRSLTACVVLTDGRGDCELSLTVSPLSTWEVMWQRTWKARFIDPVRQRWFLISIPDIFFPDPGRYGIELIIEGHPIAQTVLDILPEE